MIIVERATEDDYSDIITIDRAVIGDDRRMAYLTRAIIERNALVARIGAERVGFAVTTQSFFERFFVALLVVHPDYRRRGVGTALMHYIEKTCPDDRIFASTDDSNQNARRLLATLGFVQSGFIENLTPGERELIYVKFLDSA